jgi:DNA repair ATPase RecN
LGYNSAVAQNPDRQDKDIISQLADRGQEALGKIGDLNLPGGQKLLTSANQLKERADELQRRLRGLDALERRVDALEKKVDQLSKAKSSPARKPTTRRTSASKAAKPKPTGSGGNA